jgi:hypothetical protein
MRLANAAANNVADLIALFTAALAQIPKDWRRRILFTVDGADYSHDLIV